MAGVLVCDVDIAVVLVDVQTRRPQQFVGREAAERNAVRRQEEDIAEVRINHQVAAGRMLDDPDR